MGGISREKIPLLPIPLTAPPLKLPANNPASYPGYRVVVLFYFCCCCCCCFVFVCMFVFLCVRDELMYGMEVKVLNLLLYYLAKINLRYSSGNSWSSSVHYSQYL